MTGAATLTRPLREVAAIPMPTPVQIVKIGCAKGLMRQRTRKVTASIDPPPSENACPR